MRVAFVWVLVGVACRDPDAAPAPVRVAPVAVPIDAAARASAGGWHSVAATQARRAMVAAPTCLTTLACPPGTTATATKTGEGEQCTRPDGVADGPGHSATFPDIYDEAPPIGYTCWSMKANKLDGVVRELWASGTPKREQVYVDGEATRRITDYDASGAKTDESFDDGSLVGYFANGQKKFAGTMKPAAQGGLLREGAWTRWFETGAKRFECAYVANRVPDACDAWDERGKQIGHAVYSVGELVSGEDVGAFFLDTEPPVVGRRVSPASAIDVPALLAHCEAFHGQAIRVRGAVSSVSTCPKCPEGAMCKPCFGNYFVLELGGKRIAVLPAAKLPQVSSQVVEIAGHVHWSPGSYAIGPCMVRAE